MPSRRDAPCGHPRPASRLAVLCLLLLCALLCASCSPSMRMGESMEAYEGDMAQLQRRLVDDPGDAEALREIGLIYLRTRRYAEAYNYLKKAYGRDADDPKTLFYLGMASEKVGKQRSALRLYERYPEVKSLSPYRRRMEGRYQWVVRQMAREDMQARLAREDTLRKDAVSPRTVAVFPLAYQGSEKRYAPLGRGLSEMMTVDLANVRQLRIVERLRLQALLDELELGQSEYVDSATAPRVGRLLGAGRLIGGSYNVLGGSELRLDVALAESGRAARFPDLQTRSGGLDRLFQLEKELVFQMVDELGIELTPAERRAIEDVPTENLQAFLAYSQGLLYEDDGQFAAAARAYQRASELDPGFQSAEARAESASTLNTTSGPVSSVLSATLTVEALPPTRMGLSPIQLRTQTLTNEIGAPIVPGVDARQPVVEGLSAVPLDPPPAPPGN